MRARIRELYERLLHGALKNRGLEHLGDRAENLVVKDVLA